MGDSGNGSDSWVPVHTQEICIEFQVPGFSFGPVLAFDNIWGVNEQMGAPSASVLLK